MSSISYPFTHDNEPRELTLVRVKGTHGEAYTFGDAPDATSVAVPDFFICTTTITQSFWKHTTAFDSPALHRGANLPVENVSWNSLTAPNGFLQQVNESEAAASLRDQAGSALMFRLPTETEWEYAARGGPHWRDSYRYSGSNDIDAVAWYNRQHGDWTQPVAQKAPNQLGLYDMSGNIWEWCEDTFVRDVKAIPTDGTAYRGTSDDRVLRGGCFHNWAMHCTVSKRYEIARNFNDGCIGFRLVMA